MFFGNFNSKTTCLLKLGPIFHQAAKLGKASRNAYNPGLWLIFYDLLKNWVAEGVTSEVNDFKCSYKNWFEKIKVRYSSVFLEHIGVAMDYLMKMFME